MCWQERAIEQNWFKVVKKRGILAIKPDSSILFTLKIVIK